MDKMNLRFTTRGPANGRARTALAGVVASGNLEILLERVLADNECTVEITTSVHGFDPVWRAVLEDFVAITSPGGVKISINDSGARPDTVALRLRQAMRTLETSHD